MSLTPGTRFGAHEITARIGSGGMGEVYRARDTTLDRDVALKVLPEAFLRDPDRLARFEREARTLAALNHPHIAQIYGFESVAGARAIVMELVEGEDLRERLARGALPLDEALPVARQVADALAAAHGSGIVHRDLKPANIKLRPDGTVKVLDFGLAKLAAAVEESAAVLVDSPTITSPAMTQAGVILGTAAYMAPEQAKGRAVDKRADVWAFGVVLYEMLTGRALFAGDDVSETLAAVLRKAPDWAVLPTGTPEPVRRLLRRCLERDLHQRLPDISVARLDIDDAIVDLRSSPAGRREVRWWGIAAATGIAGIAIGTVAALSWRGAEPVADGTPRVLQITTGENITAPYLSPDGRKAVFLRDERLVVRSLESGEERELSSTESAVNPFWSPDSAQVGFFTNGEFGWELRAVSASGGKSRLVVRNSSLVAERGAPSPLEGAAWCTAGIVYSEGGTSRDLRLINDVQGQPIGRFNPEPAQGRYAYPHCLSDGRILAVRRLGGASSLVVLSPTTETVLLDLPASNPVAVRFPVMVGSSHVVFQRSEPNPGLWVLPVAPDLSGKTGPERLLVADATRPSGARGLLAYISGVRFGDRQLVWVDRKGVRLSTFGRPQREFTTPSLSPDGTQVITGGRRAEADDLWLHRQDSVVRWNETGDGQRPAWSPDATHIAYMAGRPPAIMVRSPAGTAPRPIVEGSRAAGGLSWTPDSAALVYPGANDVWMVPISPGGKPSLILQNAREPAVSPDGSLIAYEVQTAGRPEVYVTTFPTPGQSSPVSTDGGRHPRWTRDGKELFFPCGTTSGEGPGALRALCVAPMEPRVPARRGPPVRLFDAASLGLILITVGHRGYDIAPDGSRILLQTRGTTGTPTITLIENVDAWLRRTAQ